ncbi:hypothetical protein FB45DRAFT_249847 [Roridomyces roridus]|uniref:MYND-type domain-containing protein n=1 Tax=Roridomyces roridus TaxID=1738132 RepID=A0AAD7FF62_9AGAR|nr:hypothetical protein FB45DRAFT_249847 [Roridomyces roridus]
MQSVHRDLGLRNLDRLPISIRRIASLAASENRTLEQVQHIWDLMGTPTLSDSQSRAFLPVFFAILDPARIPRPEVLEFFLTDAQAQDDVMSAFLGLKGIFRLGPTGAIGGAVWPRVWAWVDFVHIHRDHLGAGGMSLPSDMMRSLYLGFLLFAGELHDHPATYELMSAAPGFWHCILEAWKCLGGVDDPAHAWLNELVRLLADSAIDLYPERLEELIDSAGSLDHLAALVVDYIRTLIKQPFHAQDPLDNMYRLVMFIAIADKIPNDLGLGVARPLGPFGIALYAGGCAEELVPFLILLCDFDEPETDFVIHQCLKLIACMAFTSPTMLRPELFASGLLQALVMITLRYEARKWVIRDNVRYFLTMLIPAALVYFHVVVAYGDALTEVQDLISGDDFKRTGLYSDWKNLFALADERIEALAEYQSPGFKAQKACDNQECGIIQESSCFKRCSGCRVFYYCSVECQKKDWRHDHKNFCPSHESLLLSADAAEPKLTFTERSFLRTLLHRNYLKERRSICAQQARVLAKYDQAKHLPDALFTFFNYCDPAHPSIEVHPIDASDAEARADLQQIVACTENPEWLDVTQRASGSGGRYQLHAMRVNQMHGVFTVEGRRPTRTWVVPLRTDETDIYAGLIELSQKLRRGELGEADLMGEIDCLLEGASNLVEIH